MNRLSMEHPTVLRTRSSHGRVCEEFNFPQGWSSQALSQVSLHVPWALDDWDGSTGVSPVHGCLHRSLCLAVLRGLLAASRSSPDVSTATAGQGSISLSHSRAARLGQPDLCCASFPARRHAPKAKKQAQSSFAQVKNKLPWGRESPERSLLQTARQWEDTHPGTPLPACSILCAIVPQQ